MTKPETEKMTQPATESPATCPVLPMVDDETLDSFLQEPSNVERLPVRPENYRREFQRMIVSAYLFSEAA